MSEDQNQVEGGEIIFATALLVVIFLILIGFLTRCSNDEARHPAEHSNLEQNIHNENH